jgi:prolyl oligopeptidase
MVRYHLFGSGKTWISEYGSADDPAQFAALLAYSPYHHVVENTKYPALIMMAADSDDRVDPMHARKFVAAVQHASGSSNPVLLRVETNAGHGGGDMVKKRVESAVDEFSFLFHQLGMRFSRPGQPK